MTFTSMLTPDVDPRTLDVQGFALRGAVFVVPLDAPLPSELGDIKVPSATLYARLAPLAADEPDVFTFVPVTGAELLSLDKVWTTFQVAKEVYVLFDLPGARYDVLFTQATRQIGLRRLDWAQVSTAVASRARTLQRTKDATPWVELPPPGSPNKAPRSSTANVGPSALPVPVTDALDDEQTS